jgi:nicotinic acid mononucleotide adenylyltransferase
VERFLKANVSPAFRWKKAPACFAATGFEPVTIVPVAPVDVAATRIRRWVREGCRIEGLVHPGVDGYIRKKGLYR